MSFRKFGRSDDEGVLSDDKDTQGVRKEGSSTFTKKDREELYRETAEELKDSEQ